MRPSRLRTATAALCVAALATLTAACGSSDSSGSSERAGESASGTPNAPDASPDAGEPEAGKPDSGESGGEVPQELDFTATTLQGAQFRGSSLAGQDAVLWFWAPWCTVCAGEAGHVREAAAEYGDDVVFVGVPGKGEQAEMDRFVETHQLDGFQHAVDADGSLWSRFSVAAQPATAFVDDSGTVEVVPGAMSADDLKQRVAELAEQ
ncbi:redoxin domain-containing protein [Streptomyces sp. JJ66]|uniref:redoxin domain-containing protein n=1 Tax=Streptomyces sp. JJ66 TaxID=2803843 RepID=UPI001C59F2FA|nr:redoxin domain-containing protein [Streptomyces sp. JJ66]MBW1603488.1 redoxin domain-containing protein [Streptomyces sp. JJ66]